MLFPYLGAAQMLARPGWAGSGVAPEPWWLRAVFYRLDPDRFQDADGDGHGDLAGVVQRLDYLQSLGVDALILDPAPGSKPLDADALSDLTRNASQHHLRVVVTISPALWTLPHTAFLEQAHSWLAAGAAGFWAPRWGSPGAESEYTTRIAELRSMVGSMPGDRVLLQDPVERLSAASLDNARVLTMTALFPTGAAELMQLRSLLEAQRESTLKGHPLLGLATPPASGSPNALVYATALLGSRGAVILDFGQELGLDLYPHGQTGVEPLMQWTPSNRTPAAPPPDSVEAKKPATPEPVFGPYRPYNPPPRSLRVPVPSTVTVVPDANIPPPLPAPDTLPGFTSGQLPSTLEDKRLNVALEERDPHSLLHAYRQLIALHHDNAALRNGPFSPLSAADGSAAIVWVRMASPGTSVSGAVLAALNPSASALTLNLDPQLRTAGFRSGPLRLLFFSGAGMESETTQRLVLPPHAALLGIAARGAEGTGRTRRR